MSVSKEWEEQVRTSYRAVTIWLGHFFLVLTLWRLALISPASLRMPLVIESALEMSLFYLTGWFIGPLSRWLGDIENTGLWLVALASANSVFLVAVLPGAVQVSTFLLIQVGAGVAFRSRWRFILVQMTTLGVCGLSFWRWLSLEVLAGEVFTLLSGLLISTAIWVFINRLLLNLGMLRAKDKVLLRQRSRLVGDLRGALDNVKVLRGLIPICAHCKRVRDDKGFWQQVEAYVHERTEAKFSHGICPTCHVEVQEELQRLRATTKVFRA